MIQLDWAAPKLTVEQVESLLMPILGSNYDGLLIEGKYLYVRSFEPVSGEIEQTIKDVYYSASAIPVPIAIQYSPPFAAKTLPDGRKLFRRKHGTSGTISGNSTGTINFSVPYENCKINKVELLNGKIGDSVNLKVYDTPTGTISGVPDYMLNQFGFDVYINNSYYEDTCNYDADLIEDMVVSLEYTNNSSESVTIYWNICLHEVVDP